MMHSHVCLVFNFRLINKAGGGGLIPPRKGNMEMVDKNGVEIKRGDTVTITGAYCKRDNGMWKVVRAPGDDGWFGSDYCLHKLNKNGTESKGKNNVAFWPLLVTFTGYFKRIEVKAYNEKYAQIEVIR